MVEADTEDAAHRHAEALADRVRADLGGTERRTGA
jgi:hypothetical protein